MWKLSIGLLLLAMTAAEVSAQQTNPGAATGSNNQLSNERSDPNAAKPYQPQKPAPDTRAAPTSSSSGVGSNSGGRPENETPRK